MKRKKKVFFFFLILLLFDRKIMISKVNATTAKKDYGLSVNDLSSIPFEQKGNQKLYEITLLEQAKVLKAAKKSKEKPKEAKEAEEKGSEKQKEKENEKGKEKGSEKGKRKSKKDIQDLTPPGNLEDIDASCERPQLFLQYLKDKRSGLLRKAKELAAARRMGDVQVPFLPLSFLFFLSWLFSF